MSAEVDCFNKLKASRMKELVMKRRTELENLCRLAHIEADTSTSLEKSTALIDSGTKSDRAYLLLLRNMSSLFSC